MGVIRKKTISKGYEGGLKYICDVCSADITATVSLEGSSMLQRLTMNQCCRYESIALPVPPTISAFHVSKMERAPVNMTQLLTLTT